MLDPETAPIDELDRELARLVRTFRTASHLAAAGVRPEGIDDDTYQWWIRAHRARWARRLEPSAAPVTPPVGGVELRKDRLRKPSH